MTFPRINNHSVNKQKENMGEILFWGREDEVDVISILIKHESCMFVCLSVCVFRSYQKSEYHEILAQGIVWGEVLICLKFKWSIGMSTKFNLAFRKSVNLFSSLLSCSFGHSKLSKLNCVFPVSIL